jgi:lysophospholipase L1-like esterase
MLPRTRASTSVAATVVRWVGAASIAAAVGAWLALVLAYQYEVAWLEDHAVAFDVLFLAGAAGIALARSVERRGIARVGPVILRLAFSVAVLAGAVFIAERAAQRLFPAPVAGLGPDVSLNALGFREREIAPKDPKRYRIVVIGDSLTFGNGVEEHDRFSNLLEGFLGPQYEVLNFGRPGNNLREHLNQLDTVLKMSPDFVLLQLYENDFETPGMMRRRPRTYPLLPSGLDGPMRRESVLYHLLLDQWIHLQEAAGLAEGYTAFMARYLRDPNSPEAHETSVLLMTFIERARAAHVSTGGVFFPALYGLRGGAENYPFDYLNDRVAKIYADAQMPYLDLLPTFLMVPDPGGLFVSHFDSHPNAKANRLAAVAILNHFLSVWQSSAHAGR